MNNPKPSIRVNVDITNPGQFFSCCGLFELADRLWPGAEGWFSEDDHEFYIACNGTLKQLISAIQSAEMIHKDEGDRYSSPIILSKPFRPLTIDWWCHELFGAKDFKVWAGTMESYGIATAMRGALSDPRFLDSNLFNVGMVVQDSDDSGKKKEPYYFDARRAPNAHSRDTGFSTNDLRLTSVAHPAVELLCLFGLQVARPRSTEVNRVYHYFTWRYAIPKNILFAATSGLLCSPAQHGYRFENWFRTGQKKHKAFRTAIPLSDSGA